MNCTIICAIETHFIRSGCLANVIPKRTAVCIYNHLRSDVSKVFRVPRLSITLRKMQGLVSGSWRSCLVRFRFSVGVRTSVSVRVFPFFFVNTESEGSLPHHVFLMKLYFLVECLEGCLVSSHGSCYFCFICAVCSWPGPPSTWSLVISGCPPHSLPSLFSLCSLFLLCLIPSSPAAACFPLWGSFVCFWGRAHCCRK